MALNDLSILYCLHLQRCNISYRYSNPNVCLAWYDNDLVQYQKDLKETELEKVFTERASNVQQTDYSGMVMSTVGDHLKQKQIGEPKPEWTEAVRQKKNEDYYNKLSKVGKTFKRNSIEKYNKRGVPNISGVFSWKVIRW